MNYLDYKEKRIQGTIEFPIAYYHLDQNHPRYQMPYHWHQECEIIRIVSGTFSLVLNGQPFSLKKGSLVFIQDGVLHGGIPDNCEYECLVFNLSQLLKSCQFFKKQALSLSDHTLEIFPLLPADNLELVHILNELFAAIQEKADGYEYTVQGFLYLMIGTILKDKLYSNSIILPKENRQHLVDLKKIFSYIENHYFEEITLTDLSKVCNLNPNYFCRYFKQMTQKTPINYLNYYRLERARQQLLETDASITEIAMNCGFHDVSYFIRIFCKEKGVTPRQYRNSQKHN